MTFHYTRQNMIDYCTLLIPKKKKNTCEKSCCFISMDNNAKKKKKIDYKVSQGTMAHGKSVDSGARQARFTFQLCHLIMNRAAFLSLSLLICKR